MSVLDMVRDPSFRRWLSRVPPNSARRILQAMFLEIGGLGLAEEARALRDGRVLMNARSLGLRLTARAERAFLQRYQSHQALRQAEDVLCTLGDVESQVAWGKRDFRVSGLKRAIAIANAGRGAVVVSAHVGPLVYYVPMLVYYLSQADQRLELVAVMNQPSAPDAVLLREQVERFASHHEARLNLLGKSPGGELQLWRHLDQAVERGAWVLMQIDVLTGGRNLRPLKLAGREVCLPGAWGAARIAQRHHVPVVPVAVRRMPSGGIRLVVEPPVEAPSGVAPLGDGSRVATAKVAQRLATVLERWILRDLPDWGLLGEAHRLFLEETA